MYAPVRIDDRDYVEGGLGDVAHLDVAVELGSQAVLVINPMVPIRSEVHLRDIPTGHGRMKRVRDKGLSWVYNQAFRMRSDSRLHDGITRYRGQHPEIEVLLLEPDPSDATLFMHSPMNFAARRAILTHAYTTTYQTLRVAASPLRGSSNNAAFLRKSCNIGGAGRCARVMEKGSGLAGRDGEEDVTQEIVLPEELRPRRNALTLQIVKGPRVGEILTVEKGEAVLGRSAEADLRIPDPSLSRLHARFEREGESLWVVDLDSRNGTAVDGSRISDRRKLENGEHVTVGNVILRFAVQDSQSLKLSRDLYEAAVRDRLTGMHNRGYFEDRLAAEFSFVRRHSSPLSVLMIDLDHFKKVNDTHGHAIGDAVLKAAASKITEGLRAEDVAARYGGEEFIVLARGTAHDGARVLAQRLRTRIGLAKVLTLNGIVNVTASIGVAVMQGEGSYKTSAELVAAADEALYAAKRNGRDQVVVNVDPQRATEKASGLASVSLSASSVLLSPPPKRE